MADSRNLSFGVRFAPDTAPLDKLNEKQRKAQEEADRTAEELKKIGTNLSDVGTRAAAAFGSVSGAGTKMGTSVRSAMLDSIKSGDSLAKTLRTGVGAAVTNVRAKLKGLGAAIKSVAGDAGSAFRHPIQTIKATLGGALNDAQREAEQLGAQADRTGDQLNSMGKKGADAGEGLIGTLKKLAVAAAAVAVVSTAATTIKDFGSAAISAAANAEETSSKFETVFKDAATDTEGWAQNFASAAHRSRNEVMGFLADSGAIFTGIGMAAEDAANMSEMMTSLSYDLASFNNLADEDAFNKLRSGLMGEAEGLKSMGIVLNDTAIKQSMLSMGLKGNFQDLDEASKVQVRFNAILAQTADAQGDVTKTAGSYTNSVKGIQGIWQDFLATAGARFTPSLNGMFNTIIDAWPTIEPMLMQLVVLLSDGLSQAVPILLQLGSELLPIFCNGLGLIFQVAQPLIPVVGQFAGTLLPPLISILSMLAGTLLPPVTQILSVICTDILVPLMPVLSTVAQAILPPVAQLLGVISPILQGIAPVLQVIGQILTVIADVVGHIIGWAADGIGAVVGFFGGLFGGAQEATAGMDSLAESAGNVASSIPDIGAIQMPAVEIPDTSAYTNTIQSVMDTAPIQAEQSWGAAKETANSGLAEIGSSAADTYGSMAEQAENAWRRMGDAAANGTAATIAQLQNLKAAELPALESPDTSAYMDTVQAALGGTPALAKESWDAANKFAGGTLAEIGANTADTYGSMAEQAENAWQRMSDAAANGVSSTIAQLSRLKEAAGSVGSITIGTAGVTTASIPGHARGTNNFEGGLTRINEEGGEMAILPSGSKIIPADQTDNIINASRHTKTVTFAPQFNVTIGGNLSEEQKEQTKEWFTQMVRDVLQTVQDEDSVSESIQASLM